eukprot:460332-Heterocapsa_arctica.AAC.1
MLNVLHRRVDFILSERADTAAAAVPDVPLARLPLIAPRAATLVFLQAEAGTVPAHWGQASRQLPN